MSAKLIFARRSNEEIQIFGGQVCADVDGKNVATIDRKTITIEVSPGTHVIKMYKSHDYGSMIGFAENQITVADGDSLVFKYAAPLTISQPGHMVVSDFVSYEKLENEICSAASAMAREKRMNDEKLRQQEERSNKNMWWWVVLIVVIPAIIWGIYEAIIWNSIF